MKPEAAQLRIEAFRKRCGEAHLYLAYRAAFPWALKRFTYLSNNRQSH